MKLPKMHKPLLVIMAVFITILACQIFPPEAEREVFSDDGDYIFDTNAILDSLAQGESDLFIPLVQTTDTPNNDSKIRDNWDYTDLLNIAESFHQWKWKESINVWNVSELRYYIECDDVESGPSILSIELFRVDNSARQGTRFVHRIVIGNPSGTIYWSETKRYPATENWQSADIAEFKIPAKTALKIAEQNGGQDLRMALSDCRVFVTIAPHLSKQEWVVRYETNLLDGWHDLLDVYVDKESGESRTIILK
jgi:hypothetical protein